MRFEVDRLISLYDHNHREASDNLNEAFEVAETPEDFQRVLNRIDEAKKQGQNLKSDIKRKIGNLEKAKK